MYGEPEDVEGECNARLFIGDDMGDNHATMRCQLQSEHEGMHEETYGKAPDNEVIVRWTLDMRESDNWDKFEQEQEKGS